MVDIAISEMEEMYTKIAKGENVKTPVSEGFIPEINSFIHSMQYDRNQLIAEKSLSAPKQLKAKKKVFERPKYRRTNAH